MKAMTVFGNWKLHKRLEETRQFCKQLRDGPLLAESSLVKVGIAPPYTALSVAAQVLAGAPCSLAGQNLFWEDEGAFTGAVSGELLQDAGCDHVLIGHSERRQLFHDSDADIRKRLLAAWRCGLTPVLCVGETDSQRDAGRTQEVVLHQLSEALTASDGGGAQAAHRELIIAYEPVWAIGTGRVAAADEAQAVHRVIREFLSGRFGSSERFPIVYGGSVKPANAAGLFSQPDIDGALVGGASLDFEAFGAIVRAAQTEAAKRQTHVL